MKPIIVAIALLTAVPAIAQAETFSFKSQSKPGTNVQAPPATPGGRPAGGGTFSVTTEASYPGGKTLTATADCVQWILPPSDRFGSNAVCKYKGAGEDAYISQFTCDPPGAASDCFGRLTGTGGQFKGRHGVFVFHPGSGGVSAGTGYWAEDMAK